MSFRARKVFGTFEKLTPEDKQGLIFCALSVARCGYTAMLTHQKLLTVDAFRFQVENGLENIFFPAFFAVFNPGLT